MNLYNRIKRNERIFLGLGIVICLFLDCNNPFFPPTGIPSQGSAPRATPSGVLDQLIKSYELKNLDLFEDLLPKDKTFQFYVAHSFWSAYQSTYNLPEEPRDTTLHDIAESPYYYWNQASEESRHQNLFSKASELEFSSRPVINDLRYIKNEVGDTVKAEVEWIGGELIVSGMTSESVLIDQPVSIEKQVFLMVKNSDDHLWVIKKWYDLSTQSSDLQ